MLSAQALSYLFKEQNLIITQATVASPEITIVQGDKELPALVLPHSSAPRTSTLVDILSKASLSDKVALVLTADLRRDFAFILNPVIFYIDDNEDFEAKYFFKSFKKEGKPVTILPPMSQLMSHAPYKKKFWEDILKPLTA